MTKGFGWTQSFIKKMIQIRDLLRTLHAPFSKIGHVKDIQYSSKWNASRSGGGHSITTGTRLGGRESKNVSFCPRSGYKNCGRGVKKWQNSAHVVVEYPLGYMLS